LNKLNLALGFFLAVVLIVGSTAIAVNVFNGVRDFDCVRYLRPETEYLKTHGYPAQNEEDCLMLEEDLVK